MKKILTAWILVFGFSATSAMADDREEDRKGIEAAMKGYVMAFYTGDVGLIEEHVHESLRKVGWAKPRKDADYRGPFNMNHEQAKDLASRWYQNFDDGADGYYKGVIYEIKEKTATAKVEAHWGFDYMHLVKNKSGKWQIYNIVWQNYEDAVNR